MIALLSIFCSGSSRSRMLRPESCCSIIVCACVVYQIDHAHTCLINGRHVEAKWADLECAFFIQGNLLRIDRAIWPVIMCMWFRSSTHAWMDCHPSILLYSNQPLN
jgi:hypothetical protein